MREKQPHLIIGGERELHLIIEAQSYLMSSWYYLPHSTPFSSVLENCYPVVAREVFH